MTNIHTNESNNKKAKISHSSMFECNNFINGAFKQPCDNKYMDIKSPINGKIIGKVALSNSKDVMEAIYSAEKALHSWKSLTIKARASIMYKFHHLIQVHAEELANIIVQENGKNKAEALASIAKGNETVEYACSLPQIAQGKILQVSKGITCHEVKEPIGIVASIVPFNFPIMVPLWSVPIALVMGNCVILKPSEKVPITMTKVASLFKEAGIPDGVFQIVQGSIDAVNSLVEQPKISAVTFVGSSKIAEIISKKCHSLNKRVLALGGAKNHLIASSDCDPDIAASDIVTSFAGCAGQRCMAASVLITIGNCNNLLEKIIAKSKNLKLGVDQGQVGPVIDHVSKEKIIKYINEAEKNGVEILVDGRKLSKERKEGNWIGPTVLKHKNKNDPALKEEIFGPVLSVLRVETFEEAIAIENSNEYGNAAAVYTSVGVHAEYFTQRFRAGMIGVNIGIPVPREPFSFGGLYGTKSKYGDLDITGEGGIEFFTVRKKITTKWIPPSNRTIDTSTHSDSNEQKNKKKELHHDAANFAGQM